MATKASKSVQASGWFSTHVLPMQSIKDAAMTMHVFVHSMYLNEH